MAAAALVTGFDLEARLHAERLDADEAAAFVKELHAPRQAVDAFDEARAQVRGDARLTEHGRSLALAEARERAEAAVEAWQREHVHPLEAEIQTLGASLAARLADEPEPPAAAVAALATSLAKVEFLHRQALYSSADDGTRRAMEAASAAVGQVPVQRSDGSWAWETLLDSDVVSRFREARLAAAAPETSARLRALERRRGVLRAMAVNARALIRDADR